ncbi:MAG: caspase family protein [Planctomycetaceae bacterium]|nr:caspase family protein [Planctomycetaceae bacterium]
MDRAIIGFLIALLSSPAGLPAAEGRKLALLVGVEQYDHSKLGLLDFCGDDVATLEAVLTKQGFRCVVLRNEKKDPQPDANTPPTAANINRALTALLEKVTRHDLILVVLTGHGLQPIGETQPYFCPQDANPGVVQNVQGKQTLVKPDSLIGIGTLLERLDQSGIGHKLLLVDACRNAPQLKGMKAGVDSVAFELPEQSGLLLSCSQGQFSFENSALGKSGRGAFLHHVILGLEGEAADKSGLITWDDLTSYVKKAVPKTVTALYAGTDVDAHQTPEGINRLAGSLVLARLTPVVPPLTEKPNLPPQLFDGKQWKPVGTPKSGQEWLDYLNPPKSPDGLARRARSDWANYLGRPEQI